MESEKAKIHTSVIYTKHNNDTEDVSGLFSVKYNSEGNHYRSPHDYCIIGINIVEVERYQI